MIRRLPFPIVLPVLLVVLLASLLASAPARAGDEVREDSPAAEAFRDAWWAETGAGDLDRAVEGYRKAADAKGSDAVRARAVYRMAVVLQRMGRTEDAVHALERLSKEFPGQADLLAKARERLSEWSAGDLKTSFAEWYKRYRYSPAFQAKIVDLVLRLGGADSKARGEASQELLTIGEPALPALRAQAGSANTYLRTSAVGLILQLGDLPPAETLFASDAWTRSADFWTRLMALEPGPERQAYARAAAAEAKDPRAAWVAAAVTGPFAVLKVLAAAHPTNEADPNSLVYALVRGPDARAHRAALHALVLDGRVDAKVRYEVAEALASWRRAGDAQDPLALRDEEILAWARSPEARVRGVAWSLLAAGCVTSPEVLQAAAARLQADPGPQGEGGPLVPAVLGGLRVAAPGLDTGPITAALAAAVSAGRLGTQHGSYLGVGDKLPGSARLPRRVLAAALARATGGHVYRAVQNWWAVAGDHPLDGEDPVAVMLHLAGACAEKEGRLTALQIAAWHIRKDVGRLLALTEEPAQRAQRARTLFEGLALNQALVSLGWDADTLAKLVAAASVEGLTLLSHSGFQSMNWSGRGLTLYTSSHYAQASVATVMALLVRDDAVRATWLQAAAAHPERFNPWPWEVLENGWASAPVHRAQVVGLLADAWKRWTPEQRVAGLDVFLQARLLDPKAPEVQALLRRFLATEGNPPAAREKLLGWIDSLTLADVRRSFDLQKPEQVDAAVSLLARLPKTEEVLDAYAVALRPDGPGYQALYNRFQAAAAPVVRKLISLLLAHRAHRANVLATNLLTQRDDAGDLPIWIQALSHRDAEVRRRAATVLGRLYDQDAIRALAHAVDDPDPDVRDAAIASLQRIEKTEALKKRWRAYAKEGGGKPK